MKATTGRDVVMISSFWPAYVPAGITRRVLLDAFTCSSFSETTFAPADAAASMTFGAGKEPAVTKPSI